MSSLKCFSVLALSALLLLGCSKSSSEQNLTPKSVDLGAVELLANQPNRFDLGDGFACVLTAHPMDPRSIELLAALQKSGKEVSTTRSAPVMLGQPLELSFGTAQIKLIPKLK